MGSLTDKSDDESPGRRAVIMFAYDMRNKGDQAIAEAERRLLLKAGYKEVTLSATYFQESAAAMPSWQVFPPMVEFKRRRLGKGQLARLAGGLMASATVAWQTLVLPLKLLHPAGRNKELFRLIRRADLVLITGGSFVNDSLSYFSLAPAMRAIYVTELCLMAYQAWLMRRISAAKIMLMPHSLGPFSSRLGRWAARALLYSCARVFARDEESVVYCKGVAPRVERAPDLALTLTPPPRQPIPGSLAVCPRFFITADRDSYVEAHARALDELMAAVGAKVFFIPSNITHGEKYDDDLAACEAIRRQMKRASDTSLVETDHIGEFLVWLGKMEMSLSTRLHPAVLSALAGTPFVSVVCEHKQDGFAAEMGLEAYCLRLAGLSAEGLERTLRRLWDERLALSGGLGERASQAGAVAAERVLKAISSYKS